MKHLSQRALVAGHLQWLEEEIAACARAEGLAPAVSPSLPLPVPPAPTLPAPPTEPTRETDPGLRLLQEEERRRGEFTKSGCWIVFTALLLLIVGTVTAIILVKYR